MKYLVIMYAENNEEVKVETNDRIEAIVLFQQQKAFGNFVKLFVDGQLERTANEQKLFCVQIAYVDPTGVQHSKRYTNREQAIEAWNAIKRCGLTPYRK